MALLRSVRRGRQLVGGLIALVLIGGTVLFAEPAFSVSTAVTSVTFSSASYVQGDVNATWTVGFTTTSGPLAAGSGQITISSTATGVVFPGSSGDYTVNKTAVTATPAVSGGGTTVTITTPVAVAASKPVTVVVTAVTNPSAGTYPASDFTVDTTLDTTPVSPSSGLTFYSTSCGVANPASCTVAGSPSQFESGDGNMTLEVSGDTDWNCFVGTAGFEAGSPPAGCNTTSGAVAAPSDPSGEIGLVNGQKFDTQCPGLETKNTPPKDDFSNVASFSDAGNVNGTFDTFLYGAVIRTTVNGNASGDVEMNQVAGNGTTSEGCRSSGDLLIAYDFLNGGTSLSFHVLTWITSLSDTSGGNNENGVTGCYSKGSPPCWGANVIIPNSADFNGQSNQSADNTTGDNGIGGTTLSVNQFAEFGINLTAALNLPPCKPFAQEVWKSRSSGSSFTSNPEDVEILPSEINKCGKITIIKNTDPLGLSKSFSYSALGLTPTTFSLNDSGDTSGGQFGSNTQEYTDVPPGNYSVTEGTEPDGFTFESLTCTSDSGSTVSPSGKSTSTETATIALGVNGAVTCTYINQQNTASLSTATTPAGVSGALPSVFPGSPVTDTATISSNGLAMETPSGTVSFYLCGPIPTGTCNSTSVSAGTGTLSGSGGSALATSSPAVNTSGSPLTPGRYCFEATWPGDANYPGKLTENGGTTGDNECFTVVTISTTTMTSPQINSANLSGNVTFGSSVTDHAVITANASGGPSGDYPSGSVAFYICNPAQVAKNSGTCSSTTGDFTNQVDSAVTTVAPIASKQTSPPFATADSSPAVTANILGTWCFAAVYTPGGTYGSVYTGSSDATTDECFTVTDTTSSSSTQNWLPNDTASVSSANGAPLTAGTLKAQLFPDANCNADGTGGDSSVVTDMKVITNGTTTTVTLVTANMTYFVDPVATPTPANVTVSWWITWTSNDTNVTGSNHCETTSMTITN